MIFNDRHVFHCSTSSLLEQVYFFFHPINYKILIFKKNENSNKINWSSFYAILHCGTVKVLFKKFLKNVTYHEQFVTNNNQNYLPCLYVFVLRKLCCKTFVCFIYIWHMIYSNNQIDQKFINFNICPNTESHFYYSNTVKYKRIITKQSLHHFENIQLEVFV